MSIVVAAVMKYNRSGILYVNDENLNMIQLLEMRKDSRDRCLLSACVPNIHLCYCKHISAVDIVEYFSQVFVHGQSNSPRQ